MRFPLPTLGKGPVPLPHFPTAHQAFIFRASEYVPAAKIAEVLGTTEENVHTSARQMGLPDFDPGDLWLKKGYITIIRRMWHILPYSQLFRLLDMDEDTFSLVLREDDFLDLKLGDKPVCEEVRYRELTVQEQVQTAQIKKIMEGISFAGAKPFDFRYDVPKISFEGKPVFDTRIIYGFSGLYLHAFDVDSQEFLPDAQLEAYKNLGINGIWTQGILSQLTPFPYDSTVSQGYEARLERMRAFTERLNSYGIKLYLYLNEPRSMPHAFFDKYPHLRGHVFEDGACLCTSVPEVQDYLRDSLEFLCRSVPLLGGFFTITRAENYTNCYARSSKKSGPPNCPRCREKSAAEVMVQTNRCMLEGVRRVSNDIKFFVWTWAWKKDDREEGIRKLPQDAILMAESELRIPCEFGGVKSYVMDYSMSINGPGEWAREEWSIAKSHGLQTAAKVQVNTTWEASTIPAIPVAPSINEHMQKLTQEGVRHLLLSWTLGGYPCANLATAAKHFYEKCDYDPQTMPTYEAQKQFVEAFKEFPFHIEVLYNGPQNAGPSTLLFEKPTCCKATMTCFAYDDLQSWCSIFTPDILETQFEKLCAKWEAGLALLPEGDASEPSVMAQATYCLFRSSLNQIRFIRARDDGCYRDAVAAAESELEIAEKMLALMNKNAAIGYEAANHYYFSKGQLAEKILNCRYIIDAFGAK